MHSRHSCQLRTHLQPSHFSETGSQPVLSVTSPHICALWVCSCLFSPSCLLIWRKEDDVFIAKLPTFEKRCETPAGTVEVRTRGLFLCVLTETNSSLQGRLDGQLDVLLCSDYASLCLVCLHIPLFSHLSCCRQHQPVT